MRFHIRRMSISSSIPLPPEIARIASETGRIVLTRDGEPVAAVVTVADLRALEGATGGEIEVEQEDDGRWIAEVTTLPGTLAYGVTEAEARLRATALAYRIMADRLDHGESVPDVVGGFRRVA